MLRTTNDLAAMLERIEAKLDLLIQALAEEEGEDPNETLDGIELPQQGKPNPRAGL